MGKATKRPRSKTREKTGPARPAKKAKVSKPKTSRKSKPKEKPPKAPTPPSLGAKAKREKKYRKDTKTEKTWRLKHAKLCEKDVRARNKDLPKDERIDIKYMVEDVELEDGSSSEDTDYLSSPHVSDYDSDYHPDEDRICLLQKWKEQKNAKEIQDSNGNVIAKETLPYGGHVVRRSNARYFYKPDKDKLMTKDVTSPGVPSNIQDFVGQKETQDINHAVLFLYAKTAGPGCKEFAQKSSFEMRKELAFLASGFGRHMNWCPKNMQTYLKAHNLDQKVKEIRKEHKQRKSRERSRKQPEPSLTRPNHSRSTRSTRSSRRSHNRSLSNGEEELYARGLGEWHIKK